MSIKTITDLGNSITINPYKITTTALSNTGPLTTSNLLVNGTVLASGNVQGSTLSTAGTVPPPIYTNTAPTISLIHNEVITSANVLWNNGTPSTIFPNISINQINNHCSMTIADLVMPACTADTPLLITLPAGNWFSINTPVGKQLVSNVTAIQGTYGTVATTIFLPVCAVYDQGSNHMLLYNTADANLNFTLGSTMNSSIARVTFYFSI